MEKSTIYLIALTLICVTCLGLGAEYFSYKYNVSQLASQTAVNTTDITSVTSPTDTTTTTTTQGSGSSVDSILSFSFTNPLAVGAINESSHSITITVPPDTDVTRIAPAITVSDNATVSPAANSAQDFTNPVDYTVTAQNGSSQKYTVTVNVASVLTSAGNAITSFTFSGLSPEVDGYISEANHTITAVVPDGTNLTKLTPVIKVSPGATVSPNSGTVQNFTGPATYTVTDIYGNTQTYTVTVVTESNSG